MIVILVLVFELMMLNACRHPDSLRDQGAAALKGDPVGYDESFKKLVNAGRYEDALHQVCERFKLKCQNISISTAESTGSRAVTHPYTNHIVLYPGAFRFIGMPHPGWLASIIEHENFHTTQSTYIRAVVVGAQARILGDRTYEAGVEYAAWEYQLKSAERFPLTCEMILEIEQQLYFYGKILEKNGTGPRDDRDELENFTMPENQRQVVLRRCDLSRDPK